MDMLCPVQTLQQTEVLDGPLGGGRSGLLRSILRNEAGNTLAIMAAGLVPMMAIVGGGVDISRSYMAESRLQQACDSGVLAARRAIASLSAEDGVNDSGMTDEAEEISQSFFQNNFPTGFMGSEEIAFEPEYDEATGTVAAAVETTVPTTVMQFFGNDEVAIAAECSARLQLSNVDVMMVLDTTGSMACPDTYDNAACNSYFSSNHTSRTDGSTNVTEAANSRLAALKSAIENFYDILDSAAGDEGRIRYGFVPYTGTVNVGYLLTALDPDYVADTTGYDSREYVSYTYRAQTNNVSRSWCQSKPNYSYNSGSRRCTYDKTGMRWEYKYLTFNTENYKNGDTVADPMSASSSSTYKWAGCILERPTQGVSNFTWNAADASISPTTALDMQIDSTPGGGTDTWKPYWPNVTYYRSYNTASSTSGTKSQTSCPHSAQLLTEMSSSELTTYLGKLKPDGGTYHDIGLLWGIKLFSSTGLFADNVNEEPDNDGAVGRHMIFMSDGQLSAGDSYSNMYGIERHRGNITGNATGSSSAYDTEQGANHIERMNTICSAIKGRGITLWVIAFNTELNSDLENCASTGRGYTADGEEELIQRFKNIASQIAELRLTV